jgi:hypothetical protein
MQLPKQTHEGQYPKYPKSYVYEVTSLHALTSHHSVSPSLLFLSFLSVSLESLKSQFSFCFPHLLLKLFYSLPTFPLQHPLDASPTTVGHIQV